MHYAWRSSYSRLGHIIGYILYVHVHIYGTGFAKKDLFDKLFFKIEFSSHSSATEIALNSDLIRAYHAVQL